MTLLNIAVALVLWWPWVAIALAVCRIAAAFGRSVPDRLLSMLRTVVVEVRPFYLPAVGVRAVQMLADGEPWWSAVVLVLAGWLNWWMWRDKDDDRWKRRRRKATEAIKRVGSRLVAVPAGAH